MIVEQDFLPLPTEGVHVKTNESPKAATPEPAGGAAAFLVATRKGDKARCGWRIAGPMFFGHLGSPEPACDVSHRA